MIEFSGELSTECKSFLLKRIIRVSFFASLIASALLCVPIVLLGVFAETEFFLFLGIPVCIFLVIVFGKTSHIKSLNASLPTKVTIQDGIIEREGEGAYNFASREISAVKTVADLGDWYHIRFYFGDKDGFFACQKSLITKGTIEEFEKLFEGQIVSQKECAK